MYIIDIYKPSVCSSNLKATSYMQTRKKKFQNYTYINKLQIELLGISNMFPNGLFCYKYVQDN